MPMGNLETISCSTSEVESNADTVGLLRGEQSGGQNNSTNDPATASASEGNHGWSNPDNREGSKDMRAGSPDRCAHTQNMAETRVESIVKVFPTRPDGESSTSLPEQGGRPSGNRSNSSNDPAPSKISSVIQTGIQKLAAGYGPARKEDGYLKKRITYLENEKHASNVKYVRNMENSNNQLQQRVADFEDRKQLAGLRNRSRNFEVQSKNQLTDLSTRYDHMEGYYKSRMENLENRNSDLESLKVRLEKNLATLEIEYSKVSKSGSYTDNSATPTLAYDTLRRLSFTVDSFSSRLVKFMPEHSDQRSKMASKYSSVVFLRGPHFPVLTLKAEVMSILFEGFENESFTEAGHSVYLDDPLKRKKEFYLLFQDFRKQNRSTGHASSSGWADRQFQKYYERTKSRVWQIVGTDDSEDLEALDQEFRKAARIVWTLHLLSFSFEPPASLFRVRHGAEFEEKYMEMAPGLQVDFKEDLLSKVAFMMIPGLQVDKFSIIKSEIYPEVTPSKPMET